MRRHSWLDNLMALFVGPPEEEDKGPPPGKTPLVPPAPPNEGETLDEYVHRTGFHSNPPPGYGPCTRPLGHTGPCAHPWLPCPPEALAQAEQWIKDTLTTRPNNVPPQPIETHEAMAKHQARERELQYVEASFGHVGEVVDSRGRTVGASLRVHPSDFQTPTGHRGIGNHYIRDPLRFSWKGTIKDAGNYLNQTVRFMGREAGYIENILLLDVMGTPDACEVDVVLHNAPVCEYLLRKALPYHEYMVFEVDAPKSTTSSTSTTTPSLAEEERLVGRSSMAGASPTTPSRRPGEHIYRVVQPEGTDCLVAFTEHEDAIANQDWDKARQLVAEGKTRSQMEELVLPCEVSTKPHQTHGFTYDIVDQNHVVMATCTKLDTARYIACAVNQMPRVPLDPS